MAITTRNNFSDLFGTSALPALEAIFKHSLQMHPMIREKLFKTISISGDLWQSSEIGDLQNFAEVEEAADYSYVSPRAGASKSLRPKKYGLGFQITREAIDDGKFSMVADQMKALAESAMDSQEQSAMDIFNGGFGTGSVGRDGLGLFSTAHTVPSGLTFRNRPTTHVDLSPSALDAALTDFETQQIRDSGKIVNMQPRVLLVHSSQRRYAMELIGSELKADTSDNNLNSLKGEGLIVMSSPRLTDTDAWFLAAAPEKTGLKLIKRSGIETSSEECFDNDTIKYKSRYREIIGFDDSYGLWGTAGI